MAMRRGSQKAGAKVGSELKTPLLSGGQAGGHQAQNAAHAAAVGGEMVELDDFTKARGGYRRRWGGASGSAGDSNGDEDLKFVWHELEPHHTLAGIALQYRVTVAQLKSANQLANEQELVTRTKIMIPTHRYGVLYSNPEEYKSADAGALTHTTANPKRAQHDDFEAGRREAFIVDVPQAGSVEPPPVEEDVHRNPSAEYLASFDHQMQSAIKAMDSTLQKQSSHDNEEVPLVRAAAPAQEWEIQFANWKTAVVALSVVLLVSFSTVYLYKYVSAPEPHA